VGECRTHESACKPNTHNSEEPHNKEMTVYVHWGDAHYDYSNTSLPAQGKREKSPWGSQQVMG